MVLRVVVFRLLRGVAATEVPLKVALLRGVALALHPVAATEVPLKVVLLRGVASVLRRVADMEVPPKVVSAAPPDFPRAAAGVRTSTPRLRSF